MSFDIRLERLLDTTPETAFERWLNDEARGRWYAPQDGFIIESESDLRVGGAWRTAFGANRDEMYTEHGVFSIFEPPNKVAYTCVFTFPDGRAFETSVTVTFEERDGKTLMTLIDAGYPTEEQRRAHERGWPSFLDRFERDFAAVH